MRMRRADLIASFHLSRTLLRAAKVRPADEGRLAARGARPRACCPYRIANPKGDVE